MSTIFSENPTWAIGIVVILFGIIAAHRLSSYRDRKNTFNKAAKEFSDTFHQELKEVYPITANWPKNIDYYLRARFDNLSAAVGTFKSHLPENQQILFVDTWFHFYCCTGRDADRNCQCYQHYEPFTGISFDGDKEIYHDNTQTYKDDFRHNVDALLEFTKQK